MPLIWDRGAKEKNTEYGSDCLDNTFKKYRERHWEDRSAVLRKGMHKPLATKELYLEIFACKRTPSV